MVTVKDGGAPPTSAAPTVRSRARWDERLSTLSAAAT